MNIVCITTGMRPDLLVQSLHSLANNSADWRVHHLTLVIDGHGSILTGDSFQAELPGHVLINTSQNVGASCARNIGAGSVPKYRRHEHVLFLDDDVYMCPDWDRRLLELAKWNPTNIISGYSHPFNHCEPWEVPTDLTRGPGTTYKFGVPLVISSVAMMMSWKTFDNVGPWDEPGGPGGSEDFALCMRARDKHGYGFAVTEPQCVLHTGLMSSKGEMIVGYSELAEQNNKLLDIYGVRGEVSFG